MSEIREVPMKGFGEWAALITQERGVCRLKITHRPGCPTLTTSTQALEDAITQLKSGASLKALESAAVCTCETVEVEIT